MENEKSMAEIMDQIEESMRIPRRGSIVNGSIIQVKPDMLIVNIGYKSDGIVPKNEVSADADFDLEARYSAGDELEVYIVNQDNGEGNVLLSVRKVSIDKDWAVLEEIAASEEPIMVKVTDVVNGGVIAYYQEIRGFIPASQLTDRFVKNLKPYIGKELKVKILEVNRQKRRAIFSHKEFAVLEKQKAREAFWAAIEIGQVISGEVKRLTNFGAFVDIGGMDGLIHVTEMSWGRIKPASEFVKVGDVIDVKVIDTNPEENKVSLSLKHLTPEPWTTFEDRYEVDHIYQGLIVNLTEFGAFVELEPGIEGLVHVSHISKEHVEKPSDVLHVGQRVDVKILEFDLDEKKVKLSMKRVEDEDYSEEESPEIHDVADLPEDVDSDLDVDVPEEMED